MTPSYSRHRQPNNLTVNGKVFPKTVLVTCGVCTVDQKLHRHQWFCCIVKNSSTTDYVSVNNRILVALLANGEMKVPTSVRRIYMLWFNFIPGLNFIFFYFELIIIHYHTQKQMIIKLKPRIKLNHYICNIDDFLLTS